MVSAVLRTLHLNVSCRRRDHSCLKGRVRFKVGVQGQSRWERAESRVTESKEQREGARKGRGR